jgi:hypothetical protein
MFIYTTGAGSGDLALLLFKKNLNVSGVTITSSKMKAYPENKDKG